ncbi:hypothetical protein CLERM_590 [Coxiella-like endosymbiont]|nr:hypothetical protein CLERM_590 [Coxiella-like endosymbiont]
MNITIQERFYEESVLVRVLMKKGLLLPLLKPKILIKKIGWQAFYQTLC